MRKILAGAFLVLVGCGGGGPSGATCPTGSTLTYENFGRQFFTQYCDRCHVSRDAPILNTLDRIRASRTSIDESTAAGPLNVNDGMPEGGATPSEAERRRLGEWLACGAP